MLSPGFLKRASTFMFTRMLLVLMFGAGSKVQILYTFPLQSAQLRGESFCLFRSTWTCISIPKGAVVTTYTLMLFTSRKHFFMVPTTPPLDLGQTDLIW